MICRILRFLFPCCFRQVPARPWRPFRIVDLETGLAAESRDGPYGGLTHMRLTTTQQATIEFGPPVDRKGRPAKVQEGSIAWNISDASARVEVDPDNPLKATIIGELPNDESGGATITISADADLGDGVREITGVEPLVVVPADAVGFGAPTVGTPTEQE
jgi:hypothetical protein